MCFLLFFVNDVKWFTFADDGGDRVQAHQSKNLQVGVYLGFKSQWLTYFFHSLNQWAFMFCWWRNYCSWIGVAINFKNRVKLMSQKNFIFIYSFSLQRQTYIHHLINIINHFFLVTIKVSLGTRWELTPVHHRQHNRATANGL